MRPRKKSRLQLVDEPGDEDLQLVASDEGPFCSGEEPEDLICGRCDRTLFLGLSRDGVIATVWSASLDPHSRTAAFGRPFPLVIDCDCGAINRVWPVIPV
jgi:hypothetical protein